MPYRKVNDNSLASVADAIRSKGGTSNVLVFPDGFVSAISAIQTGGSGGVSSGYSVTFPATATNWNKITDYAKLVLDDGSTVDFKDYSVVAGRTINNVIEIRVGADAYYNLILTLTAGAIVVSHLAGGGAYLNTYRTEAPGTTTSYLYANSGFYSFMPVEDMIISVIKLEYTGD